MTDVLLIILTIVIAGLALFVLPRWRIKRAISQVIWILREHNAVSIKNARTGEELGFRRQGILPGILTRRDYKLDALRALIKAGIIQTTEDGKLYLSEEKLISSGLYKSQTGFL